MAEKGARDTTIQDITERADVAFGSFDNHFTSKEEILGTVVNDALEMHARAVNELAAEIDDPARVIACALRATLSIAARSGV